MPIYLRLLHYISIITLLSLPNLSTASESLSLKDSISIAIQHNRSLSVATQQISAAQAQQDMATGRLLPSLDLSTGLYRTNSPLNSFGTTLQQQSVTQANFDPATLNNPTYINNYQTRLGLSLPIFNGGEVWAARESAKAHATATEFTFEAKKQQLIFQTISAYVLSRQALAQITAQENAVDAANKRWKDAKSLKRRGMVIKSDVMDAQVYLLRSQVALNQAQMMYENSLESLRFILGMQNNQPLYKLEEPSINFKLSHLDELLQHATANRADFLALQHEINAAKSEQSKAASGYYPHINLIAAQEWNSDTLGLNNGNAMVGINLSMNIFAGGADHAKTRAAQTKFITLNLQLEDKRQQIRNEINQAWRSLNIAKIQLQSETQALKQTSESLRIKSLRHRQGLEKTSDVLDAQARTDASRVAHIRATYDLIIAKAALLLTAGTLTEEVVQ
ncbi:MAG: TolC family protein [Ghiorsea sp.]